MIYHHSMIVLCKRYDDLEHAIESFVPTGLATGTSYSMEPINVNDLINIFITLAWGSIHNIQAIT